MVLWAENEILRLNYAMKANKSTFFRFVLVIGIVNLFADFTYEGGRSIVGPFLGVLGASGTIVGFVGGFGEFMGYALRSVSGFVADKTGKYWVTTFIGYAINLFAVPALALAGNWPVAALLIVMERTGRAIRRPAVETMLSYTTPELGKGWVFGLNEALDQVGATAGPLIVALVLYLNGSYRSSFAILLVPALLCIGTLAAARFTNPNPRVLEKTKKHEAKGFSSAYWTYLASGALIGAGFTGFSLISFHFQKAGTVAVPVIPILFAVAMATGAITALLFGKLLDKIGYAAALVLTSGQIWCARICPLGGSQDLLAAAGSLWKSKPDAAKTAAPVSIGFLARRSFLMGAAGIGIGFWGERLGAARGEHAPLRPPGAVDEKHFTGLCIRCGNCVRACPSKIIHADTGQAGIAGLLAPTIRYEKKYCLEDCRACTQVCPSGAIREMDLKQKRRYVIGEALVDGSHCLVPLGRKDCDLCVRACPFDAVHIRWDEERYVAYPVVSTEKCNGCGACEVVCPTNDFKAIRVWKRID